ncbi:type VII secretion integral membrane protein EccD [Streptomyces sp.]|uniref:type VII secretion integral membrane protein EccD n=1 Tax=Streptomyces sp. TaxID=1931 RepID=UPI002F3F6C5E
MSEGLVAGLCRLTVRAPEKVVDLAVPADIPIADLLPVIVGHAGDGLDEAGIEHGGWVLQRVGGHPLDAEGTPESLELHDGEVLLLRPQTEALPPVRFDNLVDAVSTAVRELPHAWTPRVSRWSLRLMVAAALLGCLTVLAVSGGDELSRAALAAGAALLVLAGAGAAGRVLDDQAGGVLLGLTTGGFLALCGVLVVDGRFSSAHPHQEVGARLLAGSAAGAIGLVLAMTVVAAFTVVFAATAVAAVAGIAGGVLMLTLDVPFSQAVAGVAAVAVIFGAFVPMLSFSLAGLRLPPLPTNAEQLQEGIDPHSGDDVADRALATDRWMSGLYLAVGTVCAVCLAGLAQHPGTPDIVTSALLALLLALHGRNLGTSWQRLGLVVPAGLGVVLLVVDFARDRGPGAHLGAAAGLLLLAILLAVASWTVPGRRMIPHWGRAGDILQSVVAIALLPAVLWVLGVYRDLRAIGG